MFFHDECELRPSSLGLGHSRVQAFRKRSAAMGSFASFRTSECPRTRHTPSFLCSLRAPWIFLRQDRSIRSLRTDKNEEVPESDLIVLR